MYIYICVYMFVLVTLLYAIVRGSPEAFRLDLHILLVFRREHFNDVNGLQSVKQ